MGLEDTQHVVEAHLGKGRLGERIDFPEIRIEYPGWLRRHVDWTRPYLGERDRMRVALAVARQSVERGSGPFASALFDADSGRLLSVGLNPRQLPSQTILHAEMIALALAEERLGRGLPETPVLELHSISEPCSMCGCLILHSGVPSLVCAATNKDVEAAGIQQPHGESLDWLDARGIQVRSDVLRAEARDILRLYRARRGATQ